MIGSRIGQYLIESQLGAGAMGVVYRAFDSRLERLVAIKVFSDLDATPKARQRLLHEARSASALNHPHICTIHEVGESGDTPYLVMEFVEGRPLSALIPAGGLPVETVALYGAQIAGALAHAHSRGVVHRDLKCLNIVVTPEGQTKVLDFGIALRQARIGSDADTISNTDAPKDSLQGPGRVAGTVDYMAPEALRGEPVDGRADVWALGVVLYEMATAGLPFPGQTPFEVSGRILHAPPLPLPERVPAALREIVLQCLEKDPSRRYQQAAGVRAALLAIPPGRPEAGRAASLQEAPSRPREGGGTGERAPTGQRRALLVLPFTNLARDPESDYFADGLTEEIIADLSSVRQLRVISRTSSMQFKGSAGSVADLARQVDVQYVLEGSVRRSGGALRITAKLIEVATDSPVWAQKYNGSLDDIFAIQETLSRAIVEALRVVLTAEEDAKLGRHTITDARAYEWYLRAKQEMLTFTKDGLDRAVDCLEKSSAIVGENALVLAATGEAYWQYVNAGISPDRAYLDKAEACARRAIELDPASPHGHRVAGLVGVHRGDIQGALRQLRRAIETDPNDPDSLLWGCLTAALSGQMRLGEAWAARLVEIDPVTPFFQTMPGAMAWFAGDYEKSSRLWSARYPAILENPLMRFVYGQSLVASGRVDDGHRILDELARAAPDNPFGQLAAVFRQALEGARKKNEMAAVLTPALVASLEGDPQYCWFLAQCYALVNDVDAGLRWLEAAVARGFINHDLLSHRDPFLASLRGDPRFGALMADVDRRMRVLEI
jgi:non-specific serine/threonine protein kinase